jgi:predicted extracellular nuclease
VALLSKYPIENLEVFDRFPPESVIYFKPRNAYEKIILPFDSFTRPVLKADIRIKPFGLVTFYVVHLKSKRPIFYDGESEENPVDLARAEVRSLMLRAAESAAVRALLMRSMKGKTRPVVLFGDVNDTGNSVTTRIISGAVPEHKLPDQTKQRIWDVLLYHVKDIQARRSYQDFYYTHIHNGMYESLDHIMVSQELVTENPRNQGRVAQVSVYNDHLIDQTFSTQKQDKCKSDHGVVTCTIELNIDDSRQPKNYKFKH